jgi:cystathionine beta-lyase
MVDSNNLMGLVATEAAYRHGEDWRRALLKHLQGNRDYLAGEIRARFPGVGHMSPEATFLAWLDCTDLGLDDDPYGFFLERPRIGFSPGDDFGPEGLQHVRLNFGTSRALLGEALDRMAAALSQAPVARSRASRV